MKGFEQRLVEYMSGSKKRFVIPVYQRSYDWKTAQCRQLFDDLVKVVRQGRQSHFFGSMVSVYNPDGRNTEFFIIDGQQRLTTVSLLFLAMCDLLERKVVTSRSPMLAQQIREEYLIDKWQPEETRMKLKPVKNDSRAFAGLFEEGGHIPGSHITENYRYFRDRIQRKEIDVDELYDAICALEIISIQLSPEDNPQLIFESLNSTGLTLSEGDKIRNFILMGLPVKQQEAFYERYWNRIEECTGEDVGAFVRDYLAVKQGVIPRLQGVYSVFKAYVEEYGDHTGELLADLLKYAGFYEILRRGNTVSERLNACIYRLNRLGTTVTRPFFLEVLRLYSEGALKTEGVTEIFQITENYIFRRLICDLPANTLNKTFLTMHREIMRCDGSRDGYTEKFKYIMLAKKERARFPGDGEFAAAFGAKPVYLMNSKNRHYLLERLENHGTREEKAVWEHMVRGEYSIEHIMPRHLTPAWMEELGEDYAEIHETWLHRMANLTLTAYNSKYSNSTFREKRDMCPNGFRDSGIRMNQRIARKDAWGLRELEERNRELQRRALEIWAAPRTDYVPPKRQAESHSLDEDIDFTGKTIARFGYKNTEQPVTSWADMYQQVLKILHGEDKSVLSGLAYTSDMDAELALHVGSSQRFFSRCVEIDRDIYVFADACTQHKILALRRFFVLYGKDPEDLVFYMKDEADEEYAPAGIRCCKM